MSGYAIPRPTSLDKPSNTKDACTKVPEYRGKMTDSRTGEVFAVFVGEHFGI